jgi:membrane protease YdiL (CAAX protease family)
MLDSPEPDEQHSLPIDPLVQTPRREWGIADFLIFALFFVLTVVLLPAAAIYVLGLFRPNLRLSQLTAIDQIAVQGVMNLVLIAFIMFLVKVVHRARFLEMISWTHSPLYSRGSLISLGTTLAITVLLTSSLFPTPNPTPIEKLISSMESLYVFALFGIAVAPLFEEMIFRGFLFRVFSDMGGARIAVPGTAFLFALLHSLQLWGNWIAILLIFAVGFVLAFVRYRSGSMIPGLIVHMSYNATLFAITAISTLLQKAGKPS